MAWEDSKGVVKLTVIWSEERYYSPNWPSDTLAVPALDVKRDGQKERQSHETGEEGEKPDVIGAATNIRDIEEENTRDSACTRSVHTELVFPRNDRIA